MHCIACDAQLSETSSSMELCETCLAVIRELNKDLYADKDDKDE